MATPARSTKYNSLGIAFAPASSVLLDATNIDASADIEFGIVAKVDALEVVVISGTAKTGTPSIVFSIQAFDEASQTWENLLSSAAVTNSGTTTLIISHHATGVTNAVAQRVPRNRMRLHIVYTGTPVTDVLNNVTATAHVI